jgi:two-component system, OmpR family, copper resistance phosphate regulon response regulator CusR
MSSCHRQRDRSAKVSRILIVEDEKRLSRFLEKGGALGPHPGPLRSGAGSETTVLEVGGVRLDLRTRRASRAGQSITLTGREFTMLEILMRHAGQVLSREQLLSHVWGDPPTYGAYDPDPGSNVVEVYVGYQKLGDDTIQVRGMGT